MCFEYQRIKFQWKKLVKIFSFACGWGQGGWPPPLPLTVSLRVNNSFFTTSLSFPCKFNVQNIEIYQFSSICKISNKLEGECGKQFKGVGISQSIWSWSSFVALFNLYNTSAIRAWWQVFFCNLLSSNARHWCLSCALQFFGALLLRRSLQWRSRVAEPWVLLLQLLSKPTNLPHPVVGVLSIKEDEVRASRLCLLQAWLDWSTAQKNY